MGITFSRTSDAAARRSKEIEKVIKRDYENSRSIFKLLLLGAGECGKSTILKQIRIDHDDTYETLAHYLPGSMSKQGDKTQRILHAGGFSESDIAYHREAILGSTIRSMCSIIQAMDILRIQYELESNRISAKAVLFAEQIWNIEKDISADVWICLKSLWSDSGIQACYKRSNEYQLGDSARYFFDNIDRISNIRYQPTQDDILCVQTPTCGIVELTIPLMGTYLTIIDVGGQRSQRKKWIHCFDGVHSLIFIAAWSEYNQNLLEDSRRNRLQESLRLYKTIISTRWFRKTPMILFLNKTDIFKEKLQFFPLRIAFPEYKGSQDYDEAGEYVERLFTNIMTKRMEDFYVHRTCATDTKNVQFVMDASFGLIFTKNAKNAGLS